MASLNTIRYKDREPSNIGLRAAHNDVIPNMGRFLDSKCPASKN